MQDRNKYGEHNKTLINSQCKNQSNDQTNSQSNSKRNTPVPAIRVAVASLIAAKLHIRTSKPAHAVAADTFQHNHDKDSKDYPATFNRRVGARGLFLRGTAAAATAVAGTFVVVVVPVVAFVVVVRR